jgi:hypothetical protein
MPPKPAKVPEKVVSKDETLIFYVEVKCNDVTEKLAVNSSCRLDIIADFVKRSFQKLLSERVATLIAHDSDDQSLITNLKEFQATLVSVTVMDLLFQDTQNTTVQWTEVFSSGFFFLVKN